MTWEEFDEYKATVEGIQTSIDNLVEQVVNLTSPYPLQQKDKAQQYLAYAKDELGKLLFDTETNLKADVTVGRRIEVVEEPLVEPEPIIIPPTPEPEPFGFNPVNQ